MDEVISWVESFHNIHVYQITVMDTLNIVQFYVSTIPQ